MPYFGKEYEKYVLEDIESFKGLYTSKDAGTIERLCVKKVNINRLHPNPEDECCMPEIGPSEGIVSEYVKNFTLNLARNEEPFKEPIMVNKMSTGGYMILNGHHRWLAARRLGLKKLPVEIVNVTHDREIIDKINKSSNHMCVSFDLDEVLFTDSNEGNDGSRLVVLLRKVLYKKYLRKNANALIRELRENGFDVWVYTDNSHSRQYINRFFSLYGCRVDGIVNGMKYRKTKGKLREAFSDKYKVSLHVDNQGVICVDTATKEYDSIDIVDEHGSWASNAFLQIKEMEIIKKYAV